MSSRAVRKIARYSVYIACRAMSAGLGYALSVIGIATGSDFGRLVALLDAAKPLSGLFDALALRANGRVIAYEMLLVKAVLLLLALAAISVMASGVATVGVIAVYVVLWWILTSYSTVFMRKQGVTQYGRLARHTGFLLRCGIRRTLTNRSTLMFMVTSTTAAAAYASLYLFNWTKEALLALRLIDATLLLVSFTAQLVIRGEFLSRTTIVGTALVTFVAAAVAQHLAGGLFGSFLLFRVGSLFACARAMKNRSDRLISLNQALLAAAYLVFGTWATDAHSMYALLVVECVSLFTLVKFGGSADRTNATAS